LLGGQVSLFLYLSLSLCVCVWMFVYILSHFCSRLLVLWTTFKRLRILAMSDSYLWAML
jgi:hypothetical protein